MRRCGLAVTDPLQIIAQPLKTVNYMHIKDFLKTYVKNENVESIVIGMPYNMDGTPSEMSRAVDQFKIWLTSQFPNLTIHDVDERLTSIEAKRIVRDTVKSKKKRRNKELVDRISASIILESYLNRKNIRNTRT